MLESVHTLLTSPEPLDIFSFFTAGIQQTPQQSHPFWVFEWDQVLGIQVIACSIVLFFAGLLCSAGGIGGGGVYVTVLMVAGLLTPRDAVPLSKAVVFFGSLSSLMLNLRRESSGAQSGDTQHVIDYNICSLVVPSSLIGTLLGVLLNHSAENLYILFVLSTILVGMSIMISWSTWCQYKEEMDLLADTASNSCVQSACHRAVVENNGKGHAHHTKEVSRIEILVDTESTRLIEKGAGQSPSRMNMLVGVGMLLVVVLSGVLRYHAGNCLWELHEYHENQMQLCHHPVPRFLIGDRLEELMSNTRNAKWTMVLTLVIPVSICSTVMAYCGHNCIKHAQWSLDEVAKYLVMGMMTGCLAGLVGIGGGLIFAPFFLFMGVDPMVAVATSSTCVIFTSSSTTFQYFFTDRIIVSLTIVYGLVNLVASYGGTVFVHFLQDNYSTRKSYITGIVAAGVLISALLAIREFAGQLTH